MTKSNLLICLMSLVFAASLNMAGCDATLHLDYPDSSCGGANSGAAGQGGCQQAAATAQVDSTCNVEEDVAAEPNGCGTVGAGNAYADAGAMVPSDDDAMTAWADTSAGYAGGDTLIPMDPDEDDVVTVYSDAGGADDL